MKAIKSILFVLFLLAVCQPAVAQLYPTRYLPPNQNWQQLITPHFQIVYPFGQKKAAYKTGRILEYQYADVQDLTGGSLSDFPVILYDYSDLSNGIVTSFHFRSEIAIPPIKGKALNPMTGGWLKNVVSHEMVHAMQFSNLGTFGLGRILNFFSPDLARSLYGAIPSGFTEGLAVYHESHGVTPGGGRGNYPWFYNQFNSTFNSPARWSLGQLVHFPVFTRPFNRYYIGGYEFNNWLIENYGHHVMRDANDFYIQLPFLGYGIALLHATGQWPWQLYDEFEDSKEDALGKVENKSLSPLSLPFEGAMVRRPKWLDGSTLVFYASFYSERPGFYRYDLNKHSVERIVTTNSVGDYNYTLSDDKNSLVYSYYRPDVTYDNTYKAELVKANLSTGKKQRITKNGRVWAPVFLDKNTLLALQTADSWSRLVKLNLEGSKIDSVAAIPPFRIIAMAVHPQDPDSLAVVINKNGVQGLWLVSRNNLLSDLKKPPDIAFKKGSIFDPVWHPSGHRILFTADFTGVMQIYEYNLQTKQITQLTNSAYNAFEASYSPDGNRIAFIIQKVNEKLPVVLRRDAFYGKILSDSFGNYLPQTLGEKDKELTTVNTSNWKAGEYSTGMGWLKPRMALPIIEEVGESDSYKLGLAFHSNSLLQTQAYTAKVSYFEDRVWYDLSYQNKQFFPGFKLRAFSQPSVATLGFKDQNDSTFIQSFVLQERSFALSVPMQFSLSQNVFYSGFYIEPELRQSQLRFYDFDGNGLSNYRNATIGNIYAQLNIRLQQNIRDVQPNSGIILYGEVEHYFSSGSLTLNTLQGQADFDFSTPTALRGGIYAYLSFFHRWNQSLRLGLQGVTQTSLLFSNQDIVSDGFADAVFPLSNNLVSFSTRYTIPLFYPDDGYLLVPLYLSNIYITAFTNTVVDPTKNDFIEASRSIFGGSLHFKFRISNLSFDIGFGVGYEPTRNQTEFFIGAY